MKHLTDDGIQSYLHSLTAAQRARIELHLNACPDCQKKLALYIKLGDLVTSVPPDPIPESFETAVMGKLRSIRRQMRMTDTIVATVAFMGFVFLGSVVYLTPQLNEIVTAYVLDFWQYGNGLLSATGGLSDAAVIAAFGIGLLVLFTMIDQLAMGRLKLAIWSGACSETDKH